MEEKKKEQDMKDSLIGLAQGEIVELGGLFAMLFFFGCPLLSCFKLKSPNSFLYLYWITILD